MIRRHVHDITDSIFDALTIISKFCCVTDLIHLLNTSNKIQKALIPFLSIESNCENLIQSIFKFEHPQEVFKSVIVATIAHHEPNTRNAIIHSFKTLLDLFTKYNYTIPYENPTAIMLWACELDHPCCTAIMQNILLDKRVDKAAWRGAALISMSTKGETEIVRALLQDRRNNEFVSQASDFAIDNGHTDIVSMFHEKGLLDPNDDDAYFLRRALAYGNEAMTRVLLHDGRIEVTLRMECEFTLACMKGDIDTVRLLLSAGVDPSCLNGEALLKAAKHGHLEIVKLLLSIKQVSPFSVDNFPLKLAAKNNHMDVVNVLLSDNRAKYSDLVFSKFMIDYAFETSNQELLRLLLEKDLTQSWTSYAALKESIYCTTTNRKTTH
jgi:hypothetical protein